MKKFSAIKTNTEIAKAELVSKSRTLIGTLLIMGSVYVPAKLIDRFVSECEEANVAVNGGALRFNKGNVTGQYFSTHTENVEPESNRHAYAI